MNGTASTRRLRPESPCRTVRDRDVEPGAPKEGFTAFRKGLSGRSLSSYGQGAFMNDAACATMSLSRS